MSELSFQFSKKNYELVKTGSIKYLIVSKNDLQLETICKINMAIIYNNTEFNNNIVFNNNIKLLIINYKEYISLAELVILNNNSDILGMNYKNDKTIDICRDIYNIYDNKSVFALRLGK